MSTPLGPPQRTEGTHLLVEYLGCSALLLDDSAGLAASLREAAAAIGARVVEAAFHRFAPQGVTGFLLLEESHISIHTWPERGYAAVDLFSCGATDPASALEVLGAGLGAGRWDVILLRRGLLGGGPASVIVTGPGVAD
jgi:S-adenosylmethionine decarboxylase proenzyme